MTKVEHSRLINLLMGMYDRSSEAIFFFNENSELLHLNEAAKDILETDVLEKLQTKESKAICLSCKGYTSAEELITCQSCYFLNPTEDFSSFQIYLQTKGKGVLPYIASFHTIDEEQGVRVLILRNLTKQLETQKTLYQNTTIKQVIKAQEDERKRISRELHDSVAQEILSSLVDVRILKYLKDEEDIEEKVQHVERSLTRLLDEIRNMSVELRPSSLDDLGIEAALRSHFKWIEKNYGLLVHYTHEIKGKRFNSEIETVVYRICQEALLNALKYAEVDEVFVHLYEVENVLVLEVNDQGIGFDVLHGPIKGTGLGIFGMKERAEYVHGQLSVNSTLGKGTQVLLQIPI